MNVHIVTVLVSLGNVLAFIGGVWVGVLIEKRRRG